MANTRYAASDMITWDTYKNELTKAHEAIYAALRNAFAENSHNPLGKAKQLQQVFEELWKIVNKESSLNEQCAYPRDTLKKIDSYYTDILSEKSLAKKIKHICNEYYIYQNMISENKLGVLTGSVHLCYYIERQFFLTSQLSKISLSDFERFVKEFDTELNDVLNKQGILKDQTISSKADKINHLKMAIDNELINRSYIKNKRVKPPSLFLHDSEYARLSEAFSELPSHDDVMKMCNQYSFKSGLDGNPLAGKLNEFKVSLSVVRRKLALVISNIMNAYLMIVGSVNDLAEVIQNMNLAKRNKTSFFKHSKFLMLCFEQNKHNERTIEVIESCKDISPAEKIGVDNGWKAAGEVIERWMQQLIDVQGVLRKQYNALLDISSQFDSRFDSLSAEQDMLVKQADTLNDQCNDFRVYYEDKRTGMANHFYNLECNIDDSLVKNRSWFASHWWKMLLTGVIVSAVTTVSVLMVMTGIAIPVVAVIGALAFIGGATAGLGIGFAAESCLPKNYGSSPGLDDAAKEAKVAAEAHKDFNAFFEESSEDEELTSISTSFSDEDVKQNANIISSEAKDANEGLALEDETATKSSWFSWFGFFGGVAPVEQELEERPESKPHK